MLVARLPLESTPMAAVVFVYRPGGAVVNRHAPYRAIMGMKGHPVMANTGGKYTGNARGGWNTAVYLR